MEKIICITGASSGIGFATAKKFYVEGWKVIALARRSDRLQQLRSQLNKDEFNFRLLSVDIRNFKEVQQAFNSLTDDWKNIDVLVNNAGLALGLDSIENGNVEDWDTMIDTNIKGVLYVSKIIIPEMIRRQNGHIINIGSIAGLEVYPRGNVYCATKHAVRALSKAMRIDLLQYGIKVTEVSPAATETEFSIVRFKGDLEKAKNVYVGYTPLSPDDIADVIFFCATRPQHVNINEVLVMPTQQASATIFNKTSINAK